MSKSIEKKSVLDINNRKLFFLYRENLESIIPNLTNCSIEEVKQLSYNYVEDNSPVKKKGLFIRKKENIKEEIKPKKKGWFK